jgi:hypothetical protein
VLLAEAPLRIPLMMLPRTIFAAALLAASLSAAAALPVLSLDKSSYTFHENDGNAVFIITRTGDLSGSSSALWAATIDGIHQSGSKISFAPNETTKTVAIPIANDDIYDIRTGGDYFELYFESGATLEKYYGTPVKILDDEPVPQVNVTDVAVAEGDFGETIVHLKVTLSNPFKGYAEYYATIAYPITATIGKDFTGDFWAPNNGQFTTTPWTTGQTSADLVVRIIGDTDPEPDEMFTVSVYLGGFPGKITATVTILNDDYILKASSDRIAIGTATTADIGSSVLAAHTDHILLSSSDTGVATVPASIDIPAGALGKTFDITGAGAGTATITATLPASRGGGKREIGVTVFQFAALSFDRPSISLSLGGTATIMAHLDPSPRTPIDVSLRQNGPRLLEMPSSFQIGTDGNGSFPITALAFGTTSILATPPPDYGGAVSAMSVVVPQPVSLAITRIDAPSGSSRGGERVSISAEHLNGRCIATFDGVSGLNTTSTSSMVTTTAPPHDAGPVDVALRCGDALNIVKSGYRYVAAPAHLTSIAPSTGSAGTLIRATGDNLRRGRCSLRFGNATANGAERSGHRDPRRGPAASAGNRRRDAAMRQRRLDARERIHLHRRRAGGIDRRGQSAVRRTRRSRDHRRVAIPRQRFDLLRQPRRSRHDDDRHAAHRRGARCLGGHGDDHDDRRGRPHDQRTIIQSPRASGTTHDERARAGHGLIRVQDQRHRLAPRLDVPRRRHAAAADRSRLDVRAAPPSAFGPRRRHHAPNERRVASAPGHLERHRGHLGLAAVRIDRRGRADHDHRQRLRAGRGRCDRPRRFRGRHGQRCPHDRRPRPAIVRLLNRDDHRDERERRFEPAHERLPLQLAGCSLRAVTPSRREALKHDNPFAASRWRMGPRIRNLTSKISRPSARARRSHVTPSWVTALHR